MLIHLVRSRPSSAWRVARRAEGQAAIFIVLFAFLFAMFGAAVIDVGLMLNARRDAQGDADNSALAGALELSLSSNPTVQATDQVSAVTHAIAWAGKNGVPNDAGLTVSLVDNCFSGSDGLATGVQVTIEREPPSFFLRYLGITEWNVGATAVACSSGRDLAVVIDRSGSMCADSLGYTSNTCPNTPSDWAPFNDVQDAAIDFSRNFSPVYDQLALVSYASTASTDRALGASFGAGSVFEAAVQDMTPGGSTNIGAALLLARGQLTGASAQTDAAKIIVLLTDGIPNLPTNTTQGQNYAQQQAQLAADAGIRIYVIGLGDGVDHTFLQQIASIGSGVYLDAPEPSDLQAAFRTIADLAQARLAQ
ncbi:MAG: VWA domain-containing protein [Dehalococcoidia bacterium]|nr:VWA domain-containing protein [Dehalococcoidia bacterium]